jgi:hypothetical protein
MNSDDLYRVFELILAGDAERLDELFAGAPDLNTPGGGDPFAAYLAEKNARIEPVHGMDTEARSVAEIVLILDGFENPLPVALFGDREAGAFSQIRVYHNLFAINGTFTQRPPILPVAQPPPEVPEVIREYFNAVHHAPSVDRVMALYAKDATMVAPTGGRRRGLDRMRPVYEMFLAGGGIVLDHCTATSDGRSCAIEWVSNRWGEKTYPPQCGSAVYDMVGDKLAAARIYDDLEPPGKNV